MEPIGDREPGDVRILWGRVAAAGGALLVAFLLGTWVSGDGGGVDEDQWDQLVSELEEERRQNEELSEYIDELSAGEAQQDRPTVDDDETDDDADDDDGETDSEQVYVVQSGDSISAIAQQFYGDTDARELIIEANDLDSDPVLQVGQELVIPPAED